MPEPRAVEAERQVLGACLLAPVADSVTLRPGDFTVEAHAVTWAAICTLVDRGEPVDPVTVWQALDADGRRAVKAPTALSDLLGGVVSAANVGYHAGIVAETARDRRLHAYGKRVQQLAESGADGKLDLARSLLDAVDDITVGESTPVADLLGETLTRLEAGRVPGVRTGLVELDEILAPMSPGQLILVGARPSMGKSSLLLTIAENVCQEVRGEGGSVDLCSLEMSREEVMHRLIASTGVPLARLRSGDMDDDAWARTARSMDAIHGLPLYVDDREYLSLGDVRALGRRGLRRGLRLLIVDYLQLMQAPKADSRQDAVASLSRGLKILAKQLGVPVLVACQLNRKAEERADKKPQLADLRESGSLEQDADVVLLLHREDFYELESPRAGEMDVIVAKQRNGRTGTVPVAWQGEYSRVRNLVGDWKRPMAGVA